MSDQPGRTASARDERIVGVLGLQGDIEKHVDALARVGARARLVRAASDLDGLMGLILPGGESTTISKGLDRNGLVEPIRAFAESGGRLLGTCAGAILLSRAARNHPVPTLGLLDLDSERNAYGTQLDSFVAPTDDDSMPDWSGLSCVFIRAPRLIDPGPGVEILARVDGAPVLVRQGLVWACTFHPELTDDARVHAAFLESS